MTRQLAFSDADPPRDRWVAAGLTIATLLDETRSAAAPVASGGSASSGPAKGGDDGPAAARPHGIGLGVGALLGNGWDHGGPMAGFWATLSLGLLQQRFFALAGASYAFSSGPDLAVQGQLNSRWLSLELGAGVQRRLATVRLFAAPELAYQSVSVTPGSGAAGTDGELQLKLRAGAAWEVTSHFGLCLGAAGRILPVGNPASDANRARRSGLIGEAFAGVELRL